MDCMGTVYHFWRIISTVTARLHEIREKPTTLFAYLLCPRQEKRTIHEPRP